MQFQKINTLYPKYCNLQQTKKKDEKNTDPHKLRVARYPKIKSLYQCCSLKNTSFSSLCFYFSLCLCPQPGNHEHALSLHLGKSIDDDLKTLTNMYSKFKFNDLHRDILLYIVLLHMAVCAVCCVNLPLNHLRDEM